jgi:hypothetical protein
MKGDRRHTVVVVAELDELVLEGCEDGVEGVKRGLLRGVCLVQLYGFFGCHGGEVDIVDEVALFSVVSCAGALRFSRMLIKFRPSARHRPVNEGPRPAGSPRVMPLLCAVQGHTSMRGASQPPAAR